MGDFIQKINDKKTNLSYKKAQVIQKNTENTVLFIYKYEDSLEKISSNISHFFFKKTFINVKVTSKKKILKQIAKHQYIFIDHDIDLLKSITIKDKKICYVDSNFDYFKKIGNDVNNLSEYQKIRNEKMFKNIDYVYSTEQGINILKNAYNIEQSKLHPIGVPKMDFYNGSHYKTLVHEVMMQYQETLTNISILYVPSRRKDMKENIQQVKFLNELSKQLNNRVVIYYLIDDELKKLYIKNKVQGCLIDKSNLGAFLKIVNLVISDYDKIIEEAQYLEAPVARFCYDYESVKTKNGVYKELSEFDYFTTTDFKEMINYIDKINFVDNLLSEKNEKSVARQIVLDVIGRFK